MVPTSCTFCDEDIDQIPSIAGALMTPKFSPEGIRDQPMNFDLTSLKVGSTILLAEDDRDQRALLHAFLTSEGYEVFACGDGMRALQIFQRNKNIDLLISDVQMPYLSGGQLALALSSQSPFLPVILMSGAELTHELRQLIEDADWLFLQKPFSLPVLLGAIHDRLHPRDLRKSVLKKSA